MTFTIANIAGGKLNAPLYALGMNAFIVGPDLSITIVKITRLLFGKDGRLFRIVTIKLTQVAPRGLLYSIA